MPVPDRIWREHSRLSLVSAAGLVLFVLGSAAAGFGHVLDADTTLLGFRVGFVGFLLLTAGLAGVVALRVFRTHPGA